MKLGVGMLKMGEVGGNSVKISKIQIIWGDILYKHHLDSSGNIIGYFIDLC